MPVTTKNHRCSYQRIGGEDEIVRSSVGTRCPTCDKPLTRRPASFYWRGVYQDGAFCEPCNALWEIVGEEIEPLKPQPSHHDSLPSDTE